MEKSKSDKTTEDLEMLTETDWHSLGGDIEIDTTGAVAKAYAQSADSQRTASICILRIEGQEKIFLAISVDGNEERWSAFLPRIPCQEALDMETQRNL